MCSLCYNYHPFSAKCHGITEGPKGKFQMVSAMELAKGGASNRVFHKSGQSIYTLLDKP